MAQEDYTSLSVSHEVKEMLKKVRGDKSIGFNQVIKNLIEQTGGTIVEDVVTIQREKVAFTLKYWNENEMKINEITYHDLAVDDVGTIYIASEYPSGNFVNSRAEIIYKSGNDVILMVEEVNRISDGANRLKSLVHVYLF